MSVKKFSERLMAVVTYVEEKLMAIGTLTMCYLTARVESMLWKITFHHIENVTTTDGTTYL